MEPAVIKIGIDPVIHLGDHRLARAHRPTAMVWIVIALLAAGRFVELFARSHSGTLALGLERAQWTSLLLIAVAVSSAWFTSVRRACAANPTGHRNDPPRSS